LSFNIVIDDAVVEAKQLFSPYGKPIIVPGRDISMNAHQADALIIRSRTQITEQLLTDNPRIRFIGSTVVGLDHVDQEACAHNGVTFYSAQGCNARSVAEYVISQIVYYAVTQRRTFSKLTLAIIGVGHVGKEVEQLANVLGINLLLNDPFRAETEPDFAHTALTHCLQQADILTLHTPLTQTGTYPSYHLINRHNIGDINKNALFINAARGDIVDENALLTRTDLTIVTDCWHNEPHINEQLLNASLLATQHIAGHAWDAKYRGGCMAADALAQWLGKTTHPHRHNDARVDFAQRTEVESTKYDELHLHQTSLVVEPNRSIEDNLIAQQQLAQILQQAYPFSQDDAQLRNRTSEQRAAEFEAYRRNYPMRREWTQQSILTTSLATQTLIWAKQLGFSI
jgi:erythronate-4-phosphate dehydrogenase